jgi:NitT/TauT family transport system substrate-binding protein
MPFPRQVTLLLLALTLAFAASACGASTESAPAEIRVAHFANITHIQPLVGLKRGDFQQEMGGITIRPIVFNAGPALIEALFAGDVDIGYVGPSPAVNGYRQSGGQALRIVAGAVSGGAAFVVRPDAGITTPADLAGKKLASPQIGNTQDVALRHYLGLHGLKTKEQGGNVEIVNLSNADIFTLFKRKEVHGAWVPEPWASRLIVDAGGHLLVDEASLWPEGTFATTVVVVRKEFLDKHPDLVDRWLRAHVHVTEWVNANQPEAKAVIREELLRLTGASLSDPVVDQAFSRIKPVDDPMEAVVKTQAEHAFALGYLGDKAPDLVNLFDQSPLQRVKG